MAKHKMFGRKVLPVEGKRPWRDIDSERGRTRTVSFYIPKSRVILWNAFVRWASKFRRDTYSHLLMEAITSYLYHLPDDEKQEFRSVLKGMAEENAQDVIDIADMLNELLRPGDDLRNILNSRAPAFVQRRKELYADAVRWFEKGKPTPDAGGETGGESQEESSGEGRLLVEKS